MAEMIQGTAEWLQARVGKMTASRAGDVIARTKAGKPTAERERYLMELVAERVTGEAVPHFVSADMLWGSEQEPRAIASYEFETGLDTTKLGFVPHPRIPMFGASPDRLVGADGLVEVKCPKTQTHLATVLSGAIPEEHYPQIDAQFACCPNRLWLDFVSFDPRIVDDTMRLFRRRVLRADRAEAIEDLEIQAGQFLSEVDARMERLVDLCRGLPRQEAA